MLVANWFRQLFGAGHLVDSVFTEHFHKNSCLLQQRVMRLNTCGFVLVRGRNRQRPNNTILLLWYFRSNIIMILRYVELCNIIYQKFSPFSTANHFPKVQLSQHCLFHLTGWSFQSIHCTLIMFYCIFITAPDSKHLASSRGLQKYIDFYYYITQKCSYICNIY